MRILALVRRVPSYLRLAIRRFPSSFTLLDRLFAFRERYVAVSELWRTRLELTVLEGRIVPDGRPLPLPVIYMGAGAGAPIVRAYDAETGDLNFALEVYESSFAGGVRVAAADITKDGYPDVVVAPGPGGGPRIRTFDGRTGDPISGPLADFLAYEPTFRGGVSVAAADVNRDGYPDVITAAGAGGGPRIRVFSGRTGSVLADFFAYDEDFRGGVSVAAADLTGDGRAEIAVGAGPGGGPRVKVYSPLTWAPIAGPLGSFFAFDEEFRGGVSVGADALTGDLDADGTLDLAVGTGPGTTARVMVLSGATGETLMDFAPFGTFQGGVRVALAYVNDDPYADPVIGSGPGMTATVKVYSGLTGTLLTDPPGIYEPFGSSTAGVFVAASNDPPAVWVASGSTAIAEGSNATITLERDGSTSGTLTVSFTLSGSASYGLDYSLAPTITATFSVGSATADVVISAEDDTLAEFTETAVLEISPYSSDGTGYTLATPAVGTVTILDDDNTWASIEGSLWLDEDDDGTVDVGEGPAEGFTVTLTGGTLTVPETAVSGSGGEYVFDGLDAGTYTLTHTPPTGFDVSVPTGGLETLTLTVSEDTTATPAGIVATAAQIIGEIWYDLDADGIQDAGEDPAVAITVTLTGGTFTTGVTAVTDTDGEYTFTNVPTDTYTLTITPPPGCGIDPPFDDGETITLTTIEVHTVTLAGLIPPPMLDGQLIVAVPNQSFSGLVAAVEGTIWAAGALDATIQWGDGATSTGTLSTGADGAAEIHGSHTYEHDGAYALVVLVDAPGFAGVLNYALGLGLVLATDGNTGMAVVGSVTVGGGGPIEQDGMTLTSGGGFTADLTGDGEYTLVAAVSSPGSHATITHSATVDFELEGDGDISSPPDSEITLTATETIAHTEQIQSPSALGTAAVTGLWQYTLSQVGTGADYLWTQTGTATSTWSGTAAAADGTFTAAAYTTATVTASGQTDPLDELHTATWSGSETATWSEGGYHGTEGYSHVQVSTGSVTGSESGGFSGSTATLLESHGGTYTLSGGHSYPGGSETLAGSGSFTQSLAVVIDESVPTVSVHATSTDTYSGSGTLTLSGVATTSTVTQSSTATVDLSGNETSGSFTQVETPSETATVTATTTHSGLTTTATVIASQGGLQTLSGSLLDGTYTLTATQNTSDATTAATAILGVTSTWLVDEDVTGTVVQSGNAHSGTYSLHGTQTTHLTADGDWAYHVTVTAGNGTTGTRDVEPALDLDVLATAVTDQTGSLATGSFSLHVVETTDTTLSPSVVDDTVVTGTGGTSAGTLTNLATLLVHDTVTQDMVGNGLTGSYTLSGTSSTTATELSSADGSGSSDNDDGTEMDCTCEISLNVQVEVATATTTGTGNLVAGTYSHHTEATATLTATVTATGSGTHLWPDDSTATHAGETTLTLYEVATATLDATGTQVAAGAASHPITLTIALSTVETVPTAVIETNYTYTLTGTSTATAYSVGSAEETLLLVVGDTLEGSDEVEVTTYATGSYAIGGSGNHVSGIHILTEYFTTTVTVLASGSAAENLAWVDGSTFGDELEWTATATAVVTESLGSSLDAATGAYSLHELTTVTRTVFVEDAVDGSLVVADGSIVGNEIVNILTEYAQESVTADQVGNAVSGAYSLHETGESTVTIFAETSGDGSLALVDGGTADGAGEATVTVYVEGASTLDATGNVVVGDYSWHLTDGGTATATEVWMDGGSATAADGSTGSAGTTITATATASWGTTADATGNALVGTYSLLESSSATATVDEVGTGEHSLALVDGAAGSGQGDWTATHILGSSATRTLTGDLTTGSYSLHVTGEDETTKEEVWTGDATFAAADGSTVDITVTVTATATMTASGTLDATGSGATGDYSLHFLGTTSSTATETSEDLVAFASSDGGSGTADGEASAAFRAVGTTTVDITGNETTGSYSLHQTDTASSTLTLSGTGLDAVTAADAALLDLGSDGTATVFASGTATLDCTGDTTTGSYSLVETAQSGSTAYLLSTLDGTVTAADSALVNWGETLTLSIFGSASTTATVTGNEATGTYSLHATESASATAYASAVEEVTVTAADTSTGDGANEGTSTAIVRSSATIDRTGNVSTGTYSLHATESSSVTVTASCDGSGTYALVDGAVGDGIDASSVTATAVDTATVDRTGNASTGTYSLLETGTSSATAFVLGSRSGSATAADTATGDWGETVTATGYATGAATVTATGNESTGAYSLHETASSTATVYVAAVSDGTVTAADSSTGDGGSGLTSTAIARDTSTLDQTGNASTGSYSLHETSTSTATVVGTGNDHGTYTLADTSTNRGTSDVTLTAYVTATATVDGTGNAASGTFSLVETGSSTGTVYETWSGDGTFLASDDSTAGVIAGGTATGFVTGTSTATLTGNASTGTYSLHERDTTTVTSTGVAAVDGEFTAADTSTLLAGGTVTTTATLTATATIDASADAGTGTYTLHQTSTGTATLHQNGTGDGSFDLIDGSTQSGTGDWTATTSVNGTATFDLNGNASTGAYALNERDTSTATVFANGDSTGTLLGADGSAGNGGGNTTSTATVTSTASLAIAGNSSTGSYSIHATDSATVTAHALTTGGGEFTLGNGMTDTGGGTLAATTYGTGSSTFDRTGNAATGTYSLLETASATATVYLTAEGESTLAGTGTWTDEASGGLTATVYQTAGTAVTATGNESTGTYSLRETDSSTVTTFATDTYRGLDATWTATASASSTTTESGNRATGGYTLGGSSTATATAASNGTDARGAYDSTANGHASSTFTGTGDWSLGTGTITVTASGGGTATITGDDGSTEYTRTLTASDAGTVTQSWNDFTGFGSLSGRSTLSATVHENGSSPTSDYTLVDAEHSTVTGTAAWDAHTGAYTLSQSETSDGSLHNEGLEGTAAEYTLDKTTTGYRNSAESGNFWLGGYTLDGTEGETSTAIETMLHGTHTASFTEILTEDGTLVEVGNAATGDYDEATWGERSADFAFDGIDGAGSFSVTAGSTGTFDKLEVGNVLTGGYSLVEETVTGYSVTQVVTGSETWTLTGTGSETATAVESGDRITGEYERDETGVDGYTLTETGVLTGGSFTQTVTGTDTYSASETGNHAKDTHAGTTVGGGTWTRISSGAGATLGSGNGTNTYTLTETGDAIAGHFDHAVIGTARYGLVERFNDVSNADSGRSPGNVRFHSHGLPFRDPTSEQLFSYLSLLPQAANIAEKAYSNSSKDYNYVSSPSKPVDDESQSGKPARVDPAWSYLGGSLVERLGHAGGNLVFKPNPNRDADLDAARDRVGELQNRNALAEGELARERIRKEQEMAAEREELQKRAKKDEADLREKEEKDDGPQYPYRGDNFNNFGDRSLNWLFKPKYINPLRPKEPIPHTMDGRPNNQKPWRPYKELSNYDLYLLVQSVFPSGWGGKARPLQQGEKLAEKELAQAGKVAGTSRVPLPMAPEPIPLPVLPEPVRPIVPAPVVPPANGTGRVPLPMVQEPVPLPVLPEPVVPVSPKPVLPPVVAPGAVVTRGTLTGSLDELTAAERTVVEDLLAQGRNVEVVPRGLSRTPDFKIDGVQTELKSISKIAQQTPDRLSAAIASRIMDGRGQATHIIVDVRGQPGVTQEIAERGIRRAYGADEKTGGKIQCIRIIGDGFDITVPRLP